MQQAGWWMVCTQGDSGMATGERLANGQQDILGGEGGQGDMAAAHQRDGVHCSQEQPTAHDTQQSVCCISVSQQ